MLYREWRKILQKFPFWIKIPLMKLTVKCSSLHLLAYNFLYSPFEHRKEFHLFHWNHKLHIGSCRWHSKLLVYWCVLHHCWLSFCNFDFDLERLPGPDTCFYRWNLEWSFECLDLWYQLAQSRYKKVIERT